MFLHFYVTECEQIDPVRLRGVTIRAETSEVGVQIPGFPPIPAFCGVGTRA